MSSTLHFSDYQSQLSDESQLHEQIFASKPPAAISQFEIRGLFGKKDFIIGLASGVRIVVGENGSGKTHMLNVLNGLLRDDCEKLMRLNFSRAVVSLADGSTIKFEKSEYAKKAAKDKEGQRMLAFIKGRLARYDYILLEKYLRYGVLSDAEMSRMNRISSNNPFLSDFLNHYFSRKSDDYDGRSRSKKANRMLNVLFFPTYRRVESDSCCSFDSDRKMMSSEIAFGMSDVKQKIESISDEIRKKSVEQFSVISGDMLNRLACGCANPPAELGNVDAVEVVLGRLSGHVEEAARSKIVSYVRTGEIFEASNNFLAHFLVSLLESYEKQQALENSLWKFCDSCNKFFTDKSIKYDPVNINVAIETVSGDNISFDDFSSGEKQVVSMLARLYLQDASDPYVVLIDEPEISLSLRWQRRLLVEILASQSCSDLIAVTHSPFVFENILDKYARDIANFCVSSVGV